jgi:hypothetical protein
MKKKMKRFQDGGVADENFTAAQLEFLGGADRTDPYILARMRKAAPDAPKEMKEKEVFNTTEGQNKNISDETRTRAMKSVSTNESSAAKPKKTAPAKTTPAKTTPASKNTVEDRDETGKVSDIRRNQETGEMYSTKGGSAEKTKEEPKKTTKSTVPADFGKVSLPKSFSESGGSTEPKKSTARLSPVNLSLPDPLSRFKKSKGDKDPAYKDAGYKKGGKVSSASRRADGCAIRGKTRA